MVLAAAGLAGQAATGVECAREKALDVLLI